MVKLRFISLPIMFLVSLLLTQCTRAPKEAALPPSDQYTNGELLVTPAWLKENRNDPNVLIIDMRAPNLYSQTHIPGAVNVPVGDITATVDGVPFEFELENVQSALNRIGLQPDTTAVIYDDLGMMNSARLFWTLEHVGHEDVRVLHGGWNAWEAGGYDTTDRTPQIDPGEYPIDTDAARLVTAQELLNQLDNPDVAIVDSRSPGEYTGDVKLAERGGHIPGAVNLPWLDVLTGGDAIYTTQDGWQSELMDEDVEMFKSASEIQAMLDQRELRRDQQVITYCQTLWRGAHTYFLLRLMGYEDVRGYDRSWVEWGNHADLPVVTGDQPGSFEEGQ